MKTNALRFALFPLLVLSALPLRPSACAQGTVTFAASAAHGLVRYSTDGWTIAGTVPVGNPAQIPGFGELNIAIYSAAPGTPGPFTWLPGAMLPPAWAESTTVLHRIAPLAGNTPTFTFTLGNIAGGASGEVMVVGWTGNAPDWNTALANPGNNLFGWSGSALSGGSLFFTASTGNPGGTPPGALQYRLLTELRGLVGSFWRLFLSRPASRWRAWALPLCWFSAAATNQHL
jgi:hypothetical protein